MEDRVGSRGSSSETETVAVVAMFVFWGGICWWLVWLVGFVKELVSGGFCMLVGCLFFSRPAKGGECNGTWVPYMYVLIIKNGLLYDQDNPSPNIRKISWDSSCTDQQTSSCLRIITNLYGPRFGYTYR